jgi:hypothetical protein
LAADPDDVAVTDRRLDHALAPHFQREQLAVADEAAGQGQDALDKWLGEDRAPAAIWPTRGTSTVSGAAGSGHSHPLEKGACADAERVRACRGTTEPPGPSSRGRAVPPGMCTARSDCGGWPPVSVPGRRRHAAEGIGFEKLRKVRIPTITANTPMLAYVGAAATVRIMSPATRNSSPGKIDRPTRRR